ncbi:8203_t:CDS:2 [Acaulospora morrowiae]|uniref:8203_t:CDS:1 n=1 Tax=Acaulospora morrowiae TaxID=94023 RepID=A0A9N9C7H9_9GLOM|nr:8203_t:CDS:2 [Acaulospora morrowiae]
MSRNHEAANSYFTVTSPSNWSYLGFLEALKLIWMFIVRDMTFADNSTIRKRYRAIELHNLGGVSFLLRGMGCRSYSAISCYGTALGGVVPTWGDGCRS